MGTDSPESFSSRLADTNGCYLVLEGGRIVHSSWVSTGSTWTREIRMFLSPPEGEAYIYESLTRPEMRGRGIYPFALRGICAHLARRGVHRAWIGVEASNDSSIRAIQKGGFEISRSRWATEGLSAG